MIRVVYTGTRPPSEVPGVEVVHMPMLQSVALPIPEDVWRLLDGGRRPIVVFCSQNALELVAEAAPDGIFDSAEIWAVGHKTAALAKDRFDAEVRTPEDDHTFEGVVDALSRRVKPDDVVVSFELADGSHRMSDSDLGCDVHSVDAYQTVAWHWDDLDSALRRANPQWVLFASSRAFQVFRANLHHRVIGDSYRVAAIGQPTSKTIAAAGERVDYVGSRPDVHQILRELADG